MLDVVQFQENQRQMPFETRAALVAPYEGQHIAWSADGLSIVAWGETIEEVVTMLDAVGIWPNQVCHDYVEEPGIVYIPTLWDASGEERTQRFPP